jgi:hypothetical protein
MKTGQQMMPWWVKNMPRDDLHGLTEAQVVASGYSVEDFKRRLGLAREAVRQGNETFARLKRHF